MNFLAHVLLSSHDSEEMVYNPVLDELFYAEKGRGASCNGEPLKVSEAQTLEKSLIATNGHIHSALVEKLR